MLYLIYLSLIKVEQRQIFKNKYYIKCHRNERVLKLLDKELIMTNLIEFYLKNIESNKINGVLLKTLKSKDFINNILTKNGGKQCSLGWSTKIYAKLCNDINYEEINGFVSIPNYKYKSLNEYIQNTQIINILKKSLNKTQEFFKTNYKLKSYHNDIITFWSKQNMNKQNIKTMKKQELINKIKQSFIYKQNIIHNNIPQKQIEKFIDIFLKFYQM